MTNSAHPTEPDETAVPSVHTLDDDQTRTSADLLGMLRDRARMLDEDAANVHDSVVHWHHDALLHDHRRTADALMREDPVRLLERLHEAGYAWRHVARLVGVSVPALRKWRRRDATPTSDNRRAIAELIALHEKLCALAVADPAGWLDAPLSGTPVTGMDLVIERRWDLLLSLANGHLDAAAALDQYRADWRTAFDSDWEAIVDEAGEPRIRRRG